MFVCIYLNSKPPFSEINNTNNKQLPTKFEKWDTVQRQIVTLMIYSVNKNIRSREETFNLWYYDPYLQMV